MAVDAAKELEKDGTKVRVVSLMCWELFEAQGQEYKDKILPPDVEARVSIEAGSTFGWTRYVGFKARPRPGRLPAASVLLLVAARACACADLRAHRLPLACLACLALQEWLLSLQPRMPGEMQALVCPAEWAHAAGCCHWRGLLWCLSTRPRPVRGVWHHHQEHGGTGQEAAGQVESCTQTALGEGRAPVGAGQGCQCCTE